MYNLLCQFRFEWKALHTHTHTHPDYFHCTLRPVWVCKHWSIDTFSSHVSLLLSSRFYCSTRSLITSTNLLMRESCSRQTRLWFDLHNRSLSFIRVNQLVCMNVFYVTGSTNTNVVNPLGRWADEDSIPAAFFMLCLLSCTTFLFLTSIQCPLLANSQQRFT